MAVVVSVLVWIPDTTYNLLSITSWSKNPLPLALQNRKKRKESNCKAFFSWIVRTHFQYVTSLRMGPHTWHCSGLIHGSVWVHSYRCLGTIHDAGEWTGVCINQGKCLLFFFSSFVFFFIYFDWGLYLMVLRGYSWLISGVTPGGNVWISSLVNLILAIRS